MEPLHIEFDLDLDRYMRVGRGMDADGEPLEGPTSLEEVVVERAAQIIAAQAARDARRSLENQAEVLLQQVVEDAVEPEVRRLLDEGVRPSNRFGEPTGEPRTLREEIARLAEEALRVRPNNDRRFPSDRTTMERVIVEEVDKALAGDLRDAAREARGQIRAALEEKGAEVMRETIERLATGRT